MRSCRLRSGRSRRSGSCTTTSAWTGAAIPTASRAKRSRWSPGSSWWPTRSRPSPPTVRTARTARPTRPWSSWSETPARSSTRTASRRWAAWCGLSCGTLPDPPVRLSQYARPVAGRTQRELYAQIDTELSWSESDLPERERTKHVHRLHPYLGKFIPQLVEELLRRHVSGGGRVLDPFAGSGTTLVQSLESGHAATGVDLAAFNCLLMRVKTGRYNPFTLEHDLRDALARYERGEGEGEAPQGFVADWFAPQAADDLLRFRSLLDS